MPQAAVSFAKQVSWVKVPDHLLPLRAQVLSKHRGQLRRLHSELERRFGTTGATDDYVNVFYAASEQALMEYIGGSSLSSGDRHALRRLWNDLLAARS